MNWANLLSAVVSSVLEIQQRHAAANPGAPPLTDVQVHEKLMKDLGDANSNINAFFIENGLPLPQ